jgi:hypothetical protein
MAILAELSEAPEIPIGIGAGKGRFGQEAQRIISHPEWSVFVAAQLAAAGGGDCLR